VQVSGNQQFEFTRPDGRVIEALPKNSAELFRDSDIETLNREHGLNIDAETCVFPGNGARMDHAMAVKELLRRDGALELDPATRHYPAHFPPTRE
jgi:aspartate/methionine/tyrosine aminotransferase